MNDTLNHANVCESIRDIKKGDVLVINRKQCGSNIIVVAKQVLENEIVMSIGSNDYFNFDMYMKGDSWVHRVWNLGQLKITSITNTTEEFER